MKVPVRALIVALIVALVWPWTMSAFAAPEDTASPSSDARADIPRRLLTESLYRAGSARGPDGYPYVYAYRVKESDADRTVATPVRDLAKSALDSAFGLAVFEKHSDTKPLWVFSAGAVADVARGRWNPDTGGALPNMNAPGTRIMFGTPSLEMIPVPLRRAIAAHMRTVENVDEPKIVLIMVKGPSGDYDDRRYVAPNIRRSAYASETAWLNALHRVEWYLPPSLISIRPPPGDTGFDRYFDIVHPIAEAAPPSTP
jgi:hypothetical protein